MKLQNVTLVQFDQAIRNANPDYGYNLVIHSDAHEFGKRKIGVQGRLTVVSSHGQGARLSASGRHCQAACWHAFRDVLANVFALAPDAIITTSLANNRFRDGTYHPAYTAANWEANYPTTGDINIGSLFNPVTMPELCDC